MESGIRTFLDVNVLSLTKDREMYMHISGNDNHVKIRTSHDFANETRQSSTSRAQGLHRHESRKRNGPNLRLFQYA